jgi:hypothetical protein
LMMLEYSLNYCASSDVSASMNALRFIVTAICFIFFLNSS